MFLAWTRIWRMADSDAAARVIAFGAAWSPASLRHHSQADTACPWCSHLGTWEHVRRCGPAVVLQDILTSGHKTALLEAFFKAFCKPF